MSARHATTKGEEILYVWRHLGIQINNSKYFLSVRDRPRRHRRENWRGGLIRRDSWTVRGGVGLTTPPITPHRGMNKITACCAECGTEGGASLKICKSCMRAKYCSAACQRNHWPKHKTACKLRAAILRDEALFKDPPPKEDCPICFLPMPMQLINCIILPPATISSVPIYDFAKASEGLQGKNTEKYYPCCGKSICGGCVHSFFESVNTERCAFCNSEQSSKTLEERVEDLLKRVEANDAASIFLLADSYYHGLNGFQQDHAKAMGLYPRAADLGCIKAHNQLGGIYSKGGYLKKAKSTLRQRLWQGTK